MSSSGILCQQIAKHFRDVHFGGNWTWVSLKEHLAQVSRDEALQQVGDFNTIAALAYHIYYYVEVQLNVLEGGPLEGNDELSWNTPDFPDEVSWRRFLEESWAAVERAASLIETLPEQRLWEPFTAEKYGSYYRNLHGNIEHCHYHAGQIVLVRKALAARQTQI
jgi:uncharacterized damage-inducible protein DinB